MITAQLRESDKEVALIVGEVGFVGYFLKKALESLRCHVFLCRVDDLASLSLNHFDYCFCLEKKLDLTSQLKLAKLTQKFRAKILYRFSEKNESLEKALMLLKINWRGVRWGSLYGPKMANEGYLGELINAGLKGKNLPVAEKSETAIRPVFIADVVYGLTKVMFAPRSSGKKYWLTGPEEVRILQLVLEWQRLLGDQRPIILKKDWPVEDQPAEQEEIWQGKIGYQEGLTECWQTPVTPSEKEKVLSPRKLARVKKKSWLWWIKPGVLLMLILLIGRCFWLGWQCYGTITLIRQVTDRGIWKSIRPSTGGGSCARLVAVGESWSWLFGDNYYLTRGLSLGRLVVQTERLWEENVDLVDKMERLLTLTFSKTNLTVKNRLAEEEALAGEVGLRLEKFYSELSLLQTNNALTGQDKERLTKARNLVWGAGQVVGHWADLFGGKERKSYLILLQNDQELRPTGGFIGSFALATFEQGEMIDWEVRDVYGADGQLKGHVEPPIALKKYLGEANWYLRDVNWEADFPLVGVKASWFLEKEIGRQVDGVIGFNLTAARRLLTAIGEVEVIDYQEKIGEKNIFERAEYHSEVNFFPGSTQKEDFLASLARAILEKLNQMELSKSSQVVSALYQSLQSKDLLFYFENPVLQKTMMSLNWHGGIQQIACLNTCLADYLMVVEANVGVNKANYYVTRQIDLVSRIGASAVRNELVIDYENTSPAEIFPGGRYRNYLRLILPKEAKIEKILLGGKEIKRDAWEETLAQEKLTVGFLVEVPIKSRMRVEIFYQAMSFIAKTWPVNYTLYLQKQPGLVVEPLSYRVILDQGLTALEFRPPAQASGKSYRFTPVFDRDVSFEVYLTK